MADNMTAGKRLIDPAPIISKLADRALHAKGKECSVLGEVIDVLMAAPLILHVEQRWIPVTERLPEEDGYYLVYEFSPFGGWCEVASFARDGRKVNEYDFVNKWENVWYGYDSEYGYITYDSVIHWMSLPEPPK